MCGVGTGESLGGGRHGGRGRKQMRQRGDEASDGSSPHEWVGSLSGVQESGLARAGRYHTHPQLRRTLSPHVCGAALPLSRAEEMHLHGEQLPLAPAVEESPSSYPSHPPSLPQGGKLRNRQARVPPSFCGAAKDEIPNLPRAPRHLAREASGKRRSCSLRYWVLQPSDPA